MSSAYIDHIQYSKDGKTLVTSGADLLAGGIDMHEIWDATSGKYLQTINSGKMDESEVRWSDDGKYLLLFGNNFRQSHNVEYWDVPGHRIVWQKIGPSGKPVCDAAAEHFILSSSTYRPNDHAVVYQMSTGDSIGVVNTYKSGVRSCTYSPDGKYLAVSTCGDCESYSKQPKDSLRIYQFGDKEQRLGIPIGKEVKTVGFSANGNQLFAASDSMVKVIETKTGNQKLSKQFPERLEKCALSATGSILITHFFAYPSYRSELNGEYLQVWETGSGKCLNSLKLTESVTAIAINHDETEMVLAMADSLFFYELKTGKRRYAFGTGYKEQYIAALAYSPDGKRMAVGLNTGSLAFIDPVNLKVVNMAEGFKSPMVKARFTSNNKFITWNDHGIDHEFEGAMENFAGYEFLDIAKEWSVLSGRQNLKAFQGGRSSARITVSRSGKYLILLNKHNGADIWNSLTGKKESSFRFNPDWQYDSFIFSANGKKIAYTTMHKVHSNHLYHLETRDIKTGRLLTSIKLPDGGYIMGVTPQLDYAFLEPYSSREKWEIWSIASKKVVYRPENQTIQSGFFQYNDDRELFFENGHAFTAFKNNTLFVNRYTTSSGPLTLHSMQIGKDSMNLQDVQISPNGRLISARTDSVLYLWQAATGKLLDSLNFHVTVDQNQFYNDNSGMLIAAFTGQKLQIADWRFTTHSKIVHKFDYQLMPFERATSIISMSVSPDNKLGLLSGANGHVITYDLNKGKLLYTLLPLILKDQFSFDTCGHFDGTPLMLKYAYYACGMSTIDFSKLKETTYEPNLISKVMGLDKRPIKAKSIIQIPICKP